MDISKISELYGRTVTGVPLVMHVVARAIERQVGDLPPGAEIPEGLGTAISGLTLMATVPALIFVGDAFWHLALFLIDRSPRLQRFLGHRTAADARAQKLIDSSLATSLGLILNCLVALASEAWYLNDGSIRSLVMTGLAAIAVLAFIYGRVLVGVVFVQEQKA